MDLPANAPQGHSRRDTALPDRETASVRQDGDTFLAQQDAPDWESIDRRIPKATGNEATDNPLKCKRSNLKHGRP
jgi:hypothetical protein